MKLRFVISLIIILMLYTTINYYIGWHGWQFLSVVLGFQYSVIYWIIFGFITLSYMLARIGSRIIPYRLASFMRLIGSYWFAIMVYALLLLLIADAVNWMLSWTTLEPRFYQFITSCVVIILIILIGMRGSWNAWNPIIRKYEVKLNKLEERVESLKIAVVSDLHLGHIVENRYLSILVDRINTMDADLILLPGDVIDDSVEPFIRQGMAGIMSGMKSRLGIYAVLGNHEYYGGQIDPYVKLMNAHGMQVLMDETVVLDNQIQIVGRKDRTAENLGLNGRMRVEELLADLNPSLPIIMMDHQPHHLDMIANAGVDVLLCGHTHRGQMMPFHWVTGRMFELDWGYLKKGNLHAIVSSGFGTWGPPIRLGSRSEIIELTINFI
ncbi:MAG: metallophosphoesterase [Paenibacillaceae bacterium]